MILGASAGILAGGSIFDYATYELSCTSIPLGILAVIIGCFARKVRGAIGVISIVGMALGGMVVIHWIRILIFAIAFFFSAYLFYEFCILPR